MLKDAQLYTLSKLSRWDDYEENKQAAVHNPVGQLLEKELGVKSGLEEQGRPVQLE